MNRSAARTAQLSQPSHLPTLPFMVITSCWGEHYGTERSQWGYCTYSNHVHSTTNNPTGPQRPKSLSGCRRTPSHFLRRCPNLAYRRALSLLSSLLLFVHRKTTYRRRAQSLLFDKPRFLQTVSSLQNGVRGWRVSR